MLPEHTPISLSCTDMIVLGCGVGLSYLTVVYSHTPPARIYLLDSSVMVSQKFDFVITSFHFW